jgi:hypothetical protein
MVFSDECTIGSALMYLNIVMQMLVDVIILQFSNRSDFWTRINHHSACNNARTAQWLFITFYICSFMNICFNTTILDKIKQDQALYTSAYMRICNTSQVSFQQENALSLPYLSLNPLVHNLK